MAKTNVRDRLMLGEGGWSTVVGKCQSQGKHLELEGCCACSIGSVEVIE